MKKTVAIFGSSGGIGQAVRQAFLDSGYTVIPVSRNLIDFASPKAEFQIQEFLSLAEPNIVVNCVGKFSNNDEIAGPTMNINFNSNWAIVQHYLKTPEPVRIIIVGSSAYKSGKKDYMIYSASKAALYNLWQGARDAFKDTPVTVSLVNPVRVKTKMVAPFDNSLDYLDPKEVAQEILQLASAEVSNCIDMNFKDIK